MTESVEVLRFAIASVCSANAPIGVVGKVTMIGVGDEIGDAVGTGVPAMVGVAVPVAVRVGLP